MTLGLDRPLRLVRADTGTAVEMPRRVLLAPMEGITDPLFRDLVINLGGVGAACSEFIRVSANVIPQKVVRRSLGAVRRDAPVAVQLMAADPLHVGASAANAEAAGAAWIDLNFGCPVPVVFNKCAGSALLCHPDRLVSIIAAARSGTRLPVTAKIRAGIDDASRLREVVLAIAGSGVEAITLHARLRRTSYAQPATWAWIAEARQALDAAGYRDLPLIGNGSIETPDDARRMLAVTGCDAVMIGRAALADPWIFRVIAGGRPADADEARDFLRRYAEGVLTTGGPGQALGILKQQIRWYRAGALFDHREDERQALLRCGDLDEVLARVAVRPVGVS